MQCVRFNFLFFILIISNAFAFAEYCNSKMGPWFSLVCCSSLFLLKVSGVDFHTIILEEKFYYELYVYSIIFIHCWSFVPLHVCMTPGLFIVMFLADVGETLCEW